MDRDCDYCGSEDGRYRYGQPEEAIGEACLDLVLRDIEDQRQVLIFEQRWRTIQSVAPENWVTHIFHAVPAPWCSLCQAGVMA